MKKKIVLLMGNCASYKVAIRINLIQVIFFASQTLPELFNFLNILLSLNVTCNESENIIKSCIKHDGFLKENLKKNLSKVENEELYEAEIRNLI